MKLLRTLLLLAVGFAAGLWAAPHLRRMVPAGEALIEAVSHRFSASPPETAAAAPGPPVSGEIPCRTCNLLLISIDTLRADRMQVYGYPRPDTPHLVDLARQGVLFERFYHSGGGTLPSHMSMLTSLNPVTHGVDVGTDTVLDPGWVTLAEQLQAHGFTTGAFVDGGWVLARFGFDAGFDRWDEKGGEFETILPKAHQWVKRHRGERFFLFLHTYDIHSGSEGYPYQCPGDHATRFAPRPPGFDGCRGGRCASELLAWTNQGIAAGERTLSDVFTREEVDGMSSAYDGCISYVDARIADFLGALQELGLYDRTVVAVTSDHGEEFGDHGMLIHDQGGYEEISHIPLILKLPRSRFAGRRVAGLAAMVDLEPTLLEILGVPVPDQAQGRSLLPAVTDGEVVREDVHMYANLVTPTWKLIPAVGGLFNLVDDPEEKVNLHGSDPALEERLEHRLRQLIAKDKAARRAHAAATGTGPALTPEEAARLRALGYLR